MSQATMRDYRIDFVRGLALITIFINHIPGNVLGEFTNRKFGFSDSAEVFVLLAGVSAAFAYNHRFTGGQMLATTIRVWRRAGLLYVAHIVSSIVAIAVFCWAAAYLAKPALLGEINIAPLISDPASGFVGLATLAHQIGYFNILPLYICLLGALPIAMLLCRFDWRLPLLVAFGVYVVSGLTRADLPSFPAEASWFFSPTSWQFLFVIGFVLGVRSRAGTALAYHPVIYWGAVAYLVFALVWVRVPQYWDLIPRIEMLGALGDYSKHHLAPSRLLHVLALAYVLTLSPVARWLTELKADNPVVQMGQHALPVFCVGSVLAVTLQIVRAEAGGSVLVDLASASGGIAVQMALAWFLTWQSRTPAGQVGSMAATGFVAATPPVPPPALLAPAQR